MQKMKMIFQILLFTSMMLCSSQALDWKTQYKAFNTEVPPKSLEPIMVKAFNTKLPDFEIKDLRFIDALDKLTGALKAADKDMILSYIVRGAQKQNKERVSLTKGTIKFGDALDKICIQVGLKWDFPRIGRLMISPKRK